MAWPAVAGSRRHCIRSIFEEPIMLRKEPGFPVAEMATSPMYLKTRRVFAAYCRATCLYSWRKPVDCPGRAQGATLIRAAADGSGLACAPRCPLVRHGAAHVPVPPVAPEDNG